MLNIWLNVYPHWIKKHSAYYKNNAQKYLKKIAKIQEIAKNIKAIKKTSISK